jgi:LPXTG-motif cell wall-anchored protein
MRRRKPLAMLLLVLAALLLLVVPAARAAETLVLTCTKCTELILTGKGLPANDQVRVSVVDVKTGAQVGGQFYVDTDANGAFIKKVPMDLGEHPSLESTVWKRDTGNVLVVAAHSRFTAPCKPEDTLAFTGSNTPLLLGIGLVLLAAGGLLLRGSRRAATPAH